MEKNSQVKPELKETDLIPFIEYVYEYYDGNLLSLLKCLDRAIYMLHYIPDELQRQNTSYNLMGLKEILMAVYYKQNGWHYVRLN